MYMRNSLPYYYFEMECLNVDTKGAGGLGVFPQKKHKSDLKWLMA